MQGFHIKSILIGLGMGIIIAAILGVICYNAGSNTVSKPSKEEVIQMAKNYGMIDPSDLIKGQGDQANQNSDKSTIKVSSDDKTPTPPADGTTKSTATNAQTADNNDTKQTQPKTVSVVIKSGDSTQTIAERLLNAGLITNKNDFFNKLTALGLSEKIETGEFKIQTGASTEDIVRIITKTKK